MQLKTVKVTNINNVLVQVPAYVVTKWKLTDSDILEVHYDEKNKSITIIPAIRNRS